MPHTPLHQIVPQQHGSPQTGATAMRPAGVGRRYALQSANSAMPPSLWEQQRLMLVSSQSNSCTAHASTVRAEAAHAGMVGLARFKR